MIFYITGPTCSGKTILVERVKQIYKDDVGLIQVGKALREKYLASLFQGQANPANTKDEALEMYHDFLAKQEAEDPLFILVDGQPRDDQISALMESSPRPKRFIHLDASVENRRKRIESRFAATTAGYDLATRRLDNDRITSYDTLMQMLKFDLKIQIIDTNREIEIWIADALRYIESQI